MAVLVEMKVVGIALDPGNNAPIVVLHDLQGKVMLPIWIGIMEASAIAAALEQVSYSRPMTHDLVGMMLKSLKARVAKVEVVDIRDNVYYAVITLERDGEQVAVDARPSDAIAIALRAGAKIFVAPHVLQDATRIQAETADDESAVGFEQDQEKLKRMLEDMDPDDFGKFKA